MKTIYFCFLFLLFTAGNTLLGQSYSSSIVRVFGMQTGTNGKQGTGVFVKVNGKSYILTCYHILIGCASIQVRSNGFGELNGITIAAYDNVKDLALLEYPTNTPHTDLDMTAIPDDLIHKSGIAVGYPNNMTRQIYPVAFSDDNGTMDSRVLRDQHANAIYKDEAQYAFRVIPLTSTIEGGMSGAPVIVDNKVVGIIAGSLNTGGSIGWAIPAFTYASQMTLLTARLTSGLSLRDLSSITIGHRCLSRSITIDDALSITYSPLDGNMDDIERGTTEYIASLNKQNALISQTIQKIDVFNPDSATVFTSTPLEPGSLVMVQSEDKSPLYTAILKLISDFENEVFNSNSINSTLEADYTTLRTVENQIINWDTGTELGIGWDSITATNFQNKLNAYNFNIQNLETNKTNKANQKMISSMNCGQREFNPAILITDCKRYLSLSKDENNYAISLMKTKLEMAKQSKIFIDLVYEAKGFASN